MNSWRRSARATLRVRAGPRAGSHARTAPATRVAERNGERSFRRSRPTRCAYCTGYSQLVALATTCTVTDLQYSTRVPQVNVLYFMKYSTFTCAVHKSCSVHGTRRGRRATRKQGPSACLRPRLLHGVDACDEVVHTALLWVDNAGSGERSRQLRARKLSRSPDPNCLAAPRAHARRRTRIAHPARVVRAEGERSTGAEEANEKTGTAQFELWRRAGHALPPSAPATDQPIHFVQDPPRQHRFPVFIMQYLASRLWRTVCGCLHFSLRRFKATEICRPLHAARPEAPSPAPIVVWRPVRKTGSPRTQHRRRWRWH